MSVYANAGLVTVGLYDIQSWYIAFLYISPYVWSSIGIAIAVGVSVLGAAW